jgi:adenylate kinase family enzyme
MAEKITLKSTDRILVLGESGSGKTYLAKHIVPNFPRHIIVSPYHGEWQGEKNVIYTVNASETYRAIEKALKAGNVFIVVDDADLFLENYLDDDNIRLLLIGSRHFGVGYLMISRRTQDVPKLLLKQANKVFIFQTDLDRDLEIIKNNFGEENANTVKNLNRATHEFLFIDRESRTAQVMHV